MPVRIGRAPQLTGLPEAHATPGFAGLAGLCLYAAEDPVDIRAIGARYQTAMRPGAASMGIWHMILRLFRAVKEYF